MIPIFTAIGNACTDLVASVDDAFLTQNNLRKSFCTHIRKASDLDELLHKIGPYKTFAGGAGANVAHVISALGGQPHFISKIAEDATGLAFRNSMEDNGIKCHFPAPAPSHLGSTLVITLVTPDRERTFVSYDVVARTFTFADYDTELLDRTKYLYLDGYGFCSPDTGNAYIKAAAIVRSRNGHVTFNVGDISIYEDNPQAVNDVLDACDSIMCNTAEAGAFFGKFDNIRQMAEHMAGRFLFGAVTDGQNGATIFYDHDIKHIPAIPVPASRIVDTNGAGDHFSGGFIYGVMNGYALEKCGQLGTLCAADCLSHGGARPLGGYRSLKHLAEQAGN